MGCVGPADSARVRMDGGEGVIRKAFVMQVFSDQYAEYEQRHNPIWPEMEAMLKAHGVHHYSIFLDEATAQLFAYVEVENEAQWNAIAQTEVCQRWWASMAALMPSNPDHSPISRDLRQVFYLD